MVGLTSDVHSVDGACFEVDSRRCRCSAPRCMILGQLIRVAQMGRGQVECCEVLRSLM